MGTGQQPSSRRCAPTPWSRTAAALVATMAAGVAAGHLTGRVPGTTAPGYDVLLVGTTSVLALLAGVKMWRDNCFESRLAAVVLAALVATGELLSATVGGPSGQAGTSYANAAVVVVLAVLVPALVGIDARVRGRSRTEVPPYAL